MKKLKTVLCLLLCLLTVSCMLLAASALSLPYEAFSVGKETFTDFDEAMQASVRTGLPAILLRDVVINAESCTIPAGAVLMIPYDSQNTLAVNVPGVDDDSQPEDTYVYRTLTLVRGSELTVEGTLAIGAGVTVAAEGKAGSPTGACGHVYLSDDSSITVADSGRLNSWGFIDGGGTVIAQSGAFVTESARVEDFTDLNDTMEAIEQGEAPFYRYSLCSIKSRLKLLAGAEDSLFVVLNDDGYGVPSTISYIGSDGLFELSRDAALTKYCGDSGETVIVTEGDVNISRSIGVRFYQTYQGFEIETFAFPQTQVCVEKGRLSSEVGILLGDEGMIKIGSGCEFEGEVTDYDSNPVCILTFDSANLDLRKPPSSLHVTMLTLNGYQPAQVLPEQYRDDYFDYTFQSWVTEPAVVTGDAEYTALYARTLRTDEGAKSRLRGDADGNGEVDILDATHIQRYLASLSADSYRIISVLGNCDGSGEISILDATRIQRYLAGFENTYHIDEIITWSELSQPVEPPTEAPTSDPSEHPSESPTEAVTEAPAETPTEAPTQSATTPVIPSPTSKYELPVL